MSDYTANRDLFKSKSKLIKELHASINGSSLNVPRARYNELTGKPIPDIIDMQNANFGDNDLFIKPGIDLIKSAGIDARTLARATHTDIKIINDIYDGKPVPVSAIPNIQTFKHALHILTVSMVISTPDTSLRATIRHLVNENGLPIETLAIYADVENVKLEAFLENQESISDSEKYRILHFARMFNTLFNGMYTYTINETETS